jgi:hypothetical protein
MLANMPPDTNGDELDRDAERHGLGVEALAPASVNAESLITSVPLTQAIADYRTRSRAAKRAP